MEPEKALELVKQGTTLLLLDVPQLTLLGIDTQDGKIVENVGLVMVLVKVGEIDEYGFNQVFAAFPLKVSQDQRKDVLRRTYF